jgi:hypothetical protein
MRNRILLVCVAILVCTALLFAQDDVDVQTFEARKGKVIISRIHTDRTPGGSSDQGKKGTWDYDDDYLYIWIEDDVCMRILMESFGYSRLRTMTDQPLKTMSNEHLRTVEQFTP